MSRQQWVGVVFALIWGAPLVELAAHKPITSPYTFLEDVLPITQARCGQCHAPDGIAPMSLLDHASAVPWGESMRLELVTGHMPPWGAVFPAARFRPVPRLTARELNVLLTWAAGGTPMGERASSEPPRQPASASAPGPNMVDVRLPTFELSADTTEATHEFVVPLDTAGRSLVAAVLIPGTPWAARRARISIRSGGPNTSEQLVALWVPGDPETPLPVGAGWTVRPGSQLVVRLTYRKRWDRQRDAVSDQSLVRLTLASGTGTAEASTVPVLPRVSQEQGSSAATGEWVATVAQRVLALSPEPSLWGAHVRVEITSATGERLLAASFDSLAGWDRRHWLLEPLAVPAGSRVVVTAQWPTAAARPTQRGPLLGLDVARDRSS